MAEDTEPIVKTENPCCAKRKERLLKMKEKRDALRKAVQMYQPRMVKLMNDVEAERARAELEKEAKEKEATARAGLEKEISILKSNIASLHEKMGSKDQDDGNEALLPRSRVSEGDAEIHRLNDLLEKERNRGEFEKNRAEVEQKKAAEVWKIVKSEKNKVEEERKLAIFERNLAEECKFSLEASRAEANELREKLVSERLMIEKIHKNLEAEKQIANREKKRAQSEMEKAEELKKCIEVDKMELLDEKNRSGCLYQKLEEAMWRRESLEKEIQELISLRKVKEDLPVTSDVSKNADGNLLLLEKQLKLEKLHVKHAKKVARFETAQNNLLKQELYHLNQEFYHFGCRVNALNDCFSTGTEGKELIPLLGKSEHELGKARYTSMGGFDPSTPCPDGIGSSTKPITCITGGPVKNQLQNSASTSTSFSDRPSVGSQENNIFSRSRPETFKDNLKQVSIVPGLFVEGTHFRINGDLGAVAENNLRTPGCRDVENLCLSLNKHARDNSKRKKLSHEVDSVGRLAAELRSMPTQLEERRSDMLILGNDMPTTKCSQIDGMLDVLGDGSSPTILLDDIHARNCRTSEKGKVSLNPGKADGNELTDNLEPEVTEHAGIFPQSVSEAGCFRETIQSCRDEIVHTNETNHDTEVSFEKMISEDIMVLLKLDDPDDEERFWMAMEMPLSPTLPEIAIPDMEAYKLNDSIISAEGTYKIDNEVLSHGFDAMSVETDSNKLKFISHGRSNSCTLQGLDSSGCTVEEPWDKSVGFRTATDIRNTSVQVSTSSTKMEVANKAYQNEVMEVPYISKYFVVFPNIKDENRISRIVSACETCISNSCAVSQKVWMGEKVLVALAKEKSLLPEEKACVFFSILLHNFLVVTTLNYGNSFAGYINSSSDSFLTHMKTVMCDAELRNILLGLFQLDTLLTLIEDFLTHKRVMLYIETSHQPHFLHDSQKIKLLDGTNVMISWEMATPDKLIAGSSILASICATTGHIGFVCDVSYKFLQMHRSDSCLTLTVLHVFASLCGSKYFNLSSRSLIMTVVMSIVRLLEGENIATKATHGSNVRCGSESRPRFNPCPECVFSQGAASMDEVLILLLKKLQDHAVAMIEHQPNIDIIDVCSLVELLAYYMSCDWTWSKVIPQLLNMVESCVSEKVSAAVILLIGQLGRFRIDDGGYEVQEVEEFRCCLAVFLRPKTRNWSLHTQLAIIHALIGLLAVGFADIVKDGKSPADTDKSIHVNLVRSWFSQLSEEQKALSYDIL